MPLIDLSLEEVSQLRVSILARKQVIQVMLKENRDKKLAGGHFIFESTVEDLNQEFAEITLLYNKLVRI